MRDRRRLAGEIDPGLSEKPKLLKIMIERIHSQSRPDIDKHRVAGVHGSLQKCLPAMPADLMAADLPVFHDPESRAGELVIQMDHSRLQPRRGGDDLKCGTGLVGIVDAAVPPHLISRVLKLRPRESAAFHIQCKRVVQIKFRGIHHGIYLPVLGIHDDHGDRLCAFLLHDLVRRLLRVLLDIHIKAHSQGISGHRLHPLLRGILEFRALRVGERQDQAVPALQVFLVHDLQTDDPLIVRPCESQYL